jgi:hypothetical protein
MKDAPRKMSAPAPKKPEPKTEAPKKPSAIEAKLAALEAKVDKALEHIGIR